VLESVGTRHSYFWSGCLHYAVLNIRNHKEKDDHKEY